jgi:hypothetical protein
MVFALVLLVLLVLGGGVGVAMLNRSKNADRPVLETVTRDLPVVEDVVERSLEDAKQRTSHGVSREVKTRVDNLVDSMERLRPRLPLFGHGSDEHTFMSIATDYLPNAISPYLALPREDAETRRLSSGRTAEHLLCDQIDTMANQIHSMEKRVLQLEEDKLLSNGRFIQERFGSEGISLPTAETSEHTAVVNKWASVGVRVESARPSLKRIG